MTNSLEELESNTTEIAGYNKDVVQLLKDSSATKKISDDCNNHFFLLLSIDNLAAIQCNHDHSFVNKLLIEIQAEINRTLQDRGVTIQSQHNQFAIIIFDTTEANIREISKDLNQHIQNYCCLQNKQDVLAIISIGSTIVEPQHSPYETMNQAYIALEDAVKDSSVHYQNYINAKKLYNNAKNNMILANYMRNAIINDKLRLAYQPIISSKTGKVMCYECLLRIEEYDGSIKSAGPYIPAVEEMGFMEEVDTIVLKKVYSDLKNNPNIVLSFNVSNYTVENGNLLPLLEEMMQDYDIASRVIVEITETGVQRNLNKVAYFIAILQGLGCKVALDDFGAGYTSFKQLKALPVDIIKIDGSFIQNMSTNADNRLFVEMLLKFTKNFGLTTIAEYVETGDVAKTLMEMEVNYLQGYYFSPAVNYKPWLSNNQDNEQLL